MDPQTGLVPSEASPARLVLAVSSARDSRGHDSRPAATVIVEGAAEVFGAGQAQWQALVGPAGEASKGRRS